MEKFSLVKEVIGVATKKDGTEIRGQGKKGPWTMYSVILENGTKLNVFGPVKEGDTVYDLEQNEQYHSWSGKVKQAGSTLYPSSTSSTSAVPDMSQPTNATIQETLVRMKKYLDERFEAVENQIAEIVLTTESKALVDAHTAPQNTPQAGSGASRDYVPTDDEMDDITEGGEPISLKDIPF